jgi:DNA-binding XRE family transcriptional regulator
MIAAALVQEIRRLLAEGRLSQRQIARQLNVSRGTVGAIATGKRREVQRSAEQGKEDPLAPSGPPQRCPQCGGMVYLPCRLCHVRNELSRSKPSRSPDRPDQPLGIELTGAMWDRYQRVYARRRQRGGLDPEPQGDDPR